MKKEDLIDMIKNPLRRLQEVRPEVNTSAQPLARLDILVGIGVAVLVLITLLFWAVSKHRAENLTASLDPKQLQGLSFAEAEFNPNTGVTYIQIQEGQDRNVAVSNLGSTLPIISRFNLKTLTDKNYEIIGAAPWALTTNFASNISDPELMQYLLGNEKMIQAFLSRPDVEPLLDDPQLLLAFTEDTAAMREFFEDETVKAVLASEPMVRVVAGSRFMSHLLVSRAGKYFRDHPQEAASIIRNNAYLARLQQNPYVQKAVKENPYLKQHAAILLKGAVQPVPAKKTSTKTTQSNTRTATRGTRSTRGTRK